MMVKKTKAGETLKAAYTSSVELMGESRQKEI
nr:MAG TPA: hypothetical protein [Bacteriophage sp.]